MLDVAVSKIIDVFILDIIIKRYELSLSGSEIARQLGASKSGVNDLLRAFEKCESLSYPLPPSITNYGIAEILYGTVPGSGGRNENIEYPDYKADAKFMATRKNMALVFLWNRYSKKCSEEGKRFYQYCQHKIRIGGSKSPGIISPGKLFLPYNDCPYHFKSRWRTIS